MDHRPHIVVVEDEATQRQLLVDYLDKQNFRVSSADGGAALRRLLERELPARSKSVLRRSTGAQPASGPRVRMGRRVLDLEKRVLADPADGSEETLTASEFDLLKLFAENPNRPLQRDWLLESAAHREMEAFDRAIDLRITRLRRKIEADPAHPDAIRTVRGGGYMFVPPKD